jgi:hypothetical protein
VHERAYVLDTVLGSWLGLTHASQTHDRLETVIRLPGADGELILSDTFFRKAEAAWLEPASLPKLPLPRWRPPSFDDGGEATGDLPILFGDPVEGGYLELGSARAVLRLDVLGSIFFMLTRYEEKVSACRDTHGRFPATASLACREGLLERPLANEYLELLWAVMQRLWPRLQRRRREYAVALEHDVDVPFRAAGGEWSAVLKSGLADLAYRRSPALLARRVAAKLAKGEWSARLDPNNTFDFIMRTSERQGLTSTFFLKAGCSNPRFDHPYDLESRAIAAILRAIHARGHRLALHPSYETWQDGQRLKAEFRHLLAACEQLDIRQEAWGQRQHYLRMSVPGTWRHIVAAGLAWDATLGFGDAPGFRAGTCYEFPVFDLEERQPLPLLERPLIAMEGSLLSPVYLGLSPMAARTRILDLAEVCRRFAGCFRLLWHNNELVTRRQQYFYAELVAEIAP